MRRQAAGRAAEKGTVRMGPISLFTLVVALCLAVMAVLAVTTARASGALAERQAAFTADDYANEAAAQELLSRVRATAAAGGAEAVEAQLEVLLAACSEGEDGPAITATANEGQVSVHVESASGRCLDATLVIAADGDVSVTSWRATTLWDETTDDVLWTGNE